MQPFRHIIRTATVATLLLLTCGVNAQTCSNSQLSCHNTTVAQDLCCFNAPGGLLLQTQFWDTDPATGPVDSWTIHGLWPDHCDGGYDANCDPNRAYTNITEILQSFNQDDLLAYMNKYWKDYQGDDESFWEHEWGKHGTCISTLEPKCFSDYQPQEEVVDYFQRAVELFKGLDSYQYLKDAGIVPSSSTQYSLSDVQAALKKPRGVSAVVQCNDDGALDEIWYYFNVRGTVADGDFVPSEPDGGSTSCSETLMYLPKAASNSTTKMRRFRRNIPVMPLRKALPKPSVR